MQVLRNVNEINQRLVSDKSRAWTEAKNRFAIDEKNSFGIASNIADQLLGTVISKMSTASDTGEEFINAQVHMTCVLPNGKILDDNVRIDSDMQLLPEYGFKGRFASLLPYIVKDSIEYRAFLPNSEGKTKSSRLFWKWDTNKLAAADCPIKVTDVSADRDRLQAERDEREGADNSDNFVSLAPEELEELAALFA
jgi:hypothetical protein